MSHYPLEFAILKVGENKPSATQQAHYYHPSKPKAGLMGSGKWACWVAAFWGSAGFRTQMECGFSRRV